MLNHWKIGLKCGLITFALFLLAMFVYGLFNEFTFWHAYSPQGTQAGIAYAIYYGVFAGPVVFLIAAFAAMYLTESKSPADSKK